MICIGDEYRVQVRNHDFFIDLLFYNRELSCLVAFELKLIDKKILETKLKEMKNLIDNNNQ